MSAVPILTCPACSRQFELTPSYLAEYGGRNTICSCGSTLPVPAASTVPTAPLPPLIPQAEVAVPPAALAVSEGPVAAQGIVLQPVLNYAGSPTIGTGIVFPAARDGKRVVVSRVSATALPTCCVRCGQPANTVITQTFYWAPRWTYLFLLGGLIPYAVMHLPVMLPMALLVGGLCYLLALLFLRKRVVVMVPLCASHLTFRTIISAVVVDAVVMAIVGPQLVSIYSPYRALPPVVFYSFIIGALIVNKVWGRAITPRRMNRTYAWFSGASPEFLAQLSEMKG